MVEARRSPVRQSITSVPQPSAVMYVAPEARSMSQEPSREPSVKVRGALESAPRTRFSVRRTMRRSAS